MGRQQNSSAGLGGGLESLDYSSHTHTCSSWSMFSGFGAEGKKMRPFLCILTLKSVVLNPRAACGPSRIQIRPTMLNVTV